MYEDVIEAFFEWRDEEHQDTLTDKSKYTYNSVLRRFFEDIGKRPENISKEDLIKWRKYRQSQGISPRTINKDMFIINQLFDYMHHQGLVDDETFYKVKNIKPLPWEKKLPKIITRGQLTAMFQQFNVNTPIGLRDALTLFFMYFTALRVEEVMLLDVQNIADDYSEIRLDARMTKGKKNPRILPITRKAFVGCLRTWIEDVRPKYAAEGETALLVDVRKEGEGTRLSEVALRDRVKRAARKAGLPDYVACHTMRHSVATHLLDEDVDIRYIQELLGHSSINSTTIYTHVSKKALAKKMQSLPNDIKFAE